MVGCSILGCRSRSIIKPINVTFHSFPVDVKCRNKWITATQRLNWSPTKHSKVCSLHFVEEMIDRTSVNCVRLRKDAVPTIITVRTEKLQNERKRKEPRILIFGENSEEIVAERISSPVFETIFLKTEPVFEYTTSKTESFLPSTSKESRDCDKSQNKMLKHKLTHVTEMCKKQKQIIKELQQSNSHLKRKVASLENILNYMQDKKYISRDQSTILDDIKYLENEKKDNSVLKEHSYSL